MPRPPRADEGGGLYHALNRGNARAQVFCKEADYEAFERILAEGLERYDVQLYCFQLMPNHWHLVLRPNCNGEMSRFVRWITATHTMRYHAHYHTSGEGHIYQGRFKSFPIQDDRHFLAACRYVERNTHAGRVCSERSIDVSAPKNKTSVHNKSTIGCTASRVGAEGGSLALGFTVALATKGRTCPTLVVALADSPPAELGRACQRTADEERA